MYSSLVSGFVVEIPNAKNGGMEHVGNPPCQRAVGKGADGREVPEPQEGVEHRYGVDWHTATAKGVYGFKSPGQTTIMIINCLGRVSWFDFFFLVLHKVRMEGFERGEDITY